MVVPEHLQTQSCGLGKPWFRDERGQRWWLRKLMCCPTCVRQCWWERQVLPNVLESLPQASLSFPSQDTWPSQASRTIWPSLGNAQWADRCQIMLCFHGRRFNAGFVSSCSRTRALNKHGAPWGPPFINQSWQGPCPGLPPRTAHPLSTSSPLLF